MIRTVDSGAEQGEEQEGPDPHKDRTADEERPAAYPVRERGERRDGEDLDQRRDGDRGEADALRKPQVGGDVGESRRRM